MANSNVSPAADKLDRAIVSLESMKKAILNRLNSNVRSLRTRASNPTMKARSKVEKMGKGASTRDSLRKETITSALNTAAKYEVARNDVKDIEASLKLLRTARRSLDKAKEQLHEKYLLNDTDTTTGQAVRQFGFELQDRVLRLASVTADEVDAELGWTVCGAV